MINKIYDSVKKFLKDFLVEICILVFTAIILLIKLPFYIDSPGGLLPTDDRVSIANAYPSKGSFNMTYVNEVKANIPLYLIALVNKNWDIVPEKEMTYGSLSVEEVLEYGRITMRESNKDAIKIAYEKAGYTVTEKNSESVLVYRASEAKTDLKVGDIFTKIDGKEFNGFDDLTIKINEHEIGDIINFEVKNDNGTYKRKAEVIDIDGEKKIGIAILQTRDIVTDPKCVLTYSNNESGSSGGLMTTLTIYNDLVKKDLTHGLVVSGTGTIERDGTVGEIAGVKYKLTGAVKKKAKIFLVPEGENYEEAIKVKKEKGYDIEIVAVKTFDDAVSYLENYKKK